MMLPKLVPLTLLVAAAVTHASPNDPALPNTQLYKVTARNCMPVDLKTWKHGTLDVLSRSDVTESVKWVELCNDKKYPVFGVAAKLDPNSTHNDKEFRRLYAELRKANGGWPLAVVLVNDGWINTIDKAGNVETETFSD
ncbi:hypothetical protein ACG04Q_17225 [Roseateles sp. DXS20W]|uniref:Secreted protein n=1 Tax=Pelomonas lactea TaxID=3299030 RepID=A0ABW7GMX1_9BURK